MKIFMNSFFFFFTLAALAGTGGQLGDCQISKDDKVIVPSTPCSYQGISTLDYVSESIFICRLGKLNEYVLNANGNSNKADLKALSQRTHYLDFYKVKKSSEIVQFKHVKFFGAEEAEVINCSQKSDPLKERILRKYVPDLYKKDSLCQRGSGVEEGFLTKISLKGKDLYILNDHKIRCVGALSAFSGSAGAEFKIIDKDLNQLYSFYALDKQKGDEKDLFNFRAKFEECKSGVRLKKLIYSKKGFSFIDKGCLSID